MKKTISAKSPGTVEAAVSKPMTLPDKPDYVNSKGEQIFVNRDGRMYRYKWNGQQMQLACGKCDRPMDECIC